MSETARYLRFGDRALIVEFGNAISPEISAKVRGMYVAVLNSDLKGIRALLPTYRSLVVEYSPEQMRYGEMTDALQALETNLGTMDLPEPNLLIVPTLYGGEGGPDMQTVVEKSGLSEQDVIAVHSGTDYLIYMLGFTPGFPYLGGMDARLETPRLASPRVKIPGGSVGIAGKQTGMYSMDSPGGWQLIGHTPIKVYDPLRAEPILYRAGDYIRFAPIDRAEYDKISAAVADGTYQYQIAPVKGGGKNV